MIFANQALDQSAGAIIRRQRSREKLILGSVSFLLRRFVGPRARFAFAHAISE
jgi:hypothetical protein